MHNASCDRCFHVLFYPTATPDVGFLLITILIVIVVLVLPVPAMLLWIKGAVRFVRTGSIRGGIRVSAVIATLQTMDWRLYFLSLVIFVFAAIFYGIITSFFSAIPYIGQVLS